MLTTDVLIKCRSCGFIASEHEFASPDHELLICPNCNDGCNLWDYEPCDKCAHKPNYQIAGDIVTTCKAYAER